MKTFILLFSFTSLIGNILIYKLHHKRIRLKSEEEKPKYKLSLPTRLFAYFKYIVYLLAAVQLFMNFFYFDVKVPGSIRLFIGSFLCISSLVLLYVSIRSLGKNYSPCDKGYIPEKRIESGPYRFFNHPIYLANYLLYLGIALLSFGYIIFAVLLMLLWFYYYSIKDENKALDIIFPRVKKKSKWLKTLRNTCLTLLLIIIILFSVLDEYIPKKAASLPCRLTIPHSEKVNINGFDLLYRDKGRKNSRIPIVVLHGGPGMSGSYLIEGLSFLEETHRVVFYDQRGAGYSQIKPDLEHYTLDKLVDELHTLRMEKIKSDKMILMGHSFGGLLALRYTIDYEKYVDRLILVSTVSAKINIPGNLCFVFDILKQGIPPEDPIEANQWFTSKLPNIFSGSFYAKEHTTNLKSIYTSFATMKAIGDSLIGYDYSEYLKRLEVKTLIIYGESEAIIAHEAGQIELHNLIKNSKLIRFAKSGHWSFIEEPEKFKKVVNDFMTE